MTTSTDQPRTNKTDAGNGSKAICRVINVLRSPSPDPKRSAKIVNPNSNLWRSISITIAVVLLSIAIWAILARSRSIPIAESDIQEGSERRRSGVSSEHPDATPGTSRSRLRPQSNSEGVTVERTTTLLRNSIAERVDFPEQTVAERITAFQGIIVETGLDAMEIQVEFDDQNPVFNKNVGQMNLREVPLETAIRYICDSAKVEFQVLPGAVAFLDPNREAEQAGTEQPATRRESKSQDSPKPQPEAEGRSR